jgi:hypothetical protein
MLPCWQNYYKQVFLEKKGSYQRRKKKKKRFWVVREEEGIPIPLFVRGKKLKLIGYV